MFIFYIPFTEIMDLGYQFYRDHFGSQFLKEKPGTAKEFPVNIPGLEVNKSLRLRVVQIWNHMFEHDEDISAVILGNQVLYQGKLAEYDSLVKKMDIYLIHEAEIVE